ncbi:MAG TPA: TonB-dependent siderophore receptor [Lacunisphaera sp.]|nr:TonB-dependent siderophore receptor [Lacunisphaera sp.]
MNARLAPEASLKPALAGLPAATIALALTGTLRADPNLPAEGAPLELPKLTVEEQRQTATAASPKFTQPLRDTPQTIVAIPREVFTQQGAMSLSDVLRNTSGITFAAGEGGSASATSGDSFYMRGFDTTNNIFVDGVRDIGAYSRDVFNIEQVDVAKGPAGSDIGRGGASGYVNISTKVPRWETFSGGSLAYGRDETTSGSRQRTTLDVNQPLEHSPVKGTAVRLNALWQDNDVIGRDQGQNGTWGIAPSLALGLGTPTRAYIIYQHTEQDNLPDYGLPSAQLPGYVSVAPVPQVDWSTYYGFKADSDKVNADATMVRLEHDFSPTLKLNNQTRYSANQREAVVTVPGTSSTAYAPATGLLTRSRQANKRDMSIVSNQTNLVAQFATGRIRHHLASGLEFARETAYQPAFVSVALTPIPIESPDPAATPSGTPARSGAYTDVITKTAALYVFDTIQFSERWQLNASLRGERYAMHYLGVATTGVPTGVDADNELFSWKTGLVFKPARAGSVYVAYANSLTPPGTDFTLSSAAGNQNNPDVDPQKATNLEAGVKWDFFEGRLSTTAAAFKTVNDKTVFTDAILGPIPAGRQTVQGVELGISRRFTENWIVLGSVSFLDSEINAGTTAGGNLAGSALPLIPRWSGNFYTSYRLPAGIVIGGGGQYSDKVARRDNNAPNVPRFMPGYWLFNAMASFPVGRHLTLRLNVNNLFNEGFVQTFNNNGARFAPGAPRSYLLSAEFRF